MNNIPDDVGHSDVDVRHEARRIIYHAQKIESSIKRNHPAGRSVINRFFDPLTTPEDPNDEGGCVLNRLDNETAEKLALGFPCLELVKPPVKKVFLESGSTPALAALGMAGLLPTFDDGGKGPELFTNNMLAHLVLQRAWRPLPRALYGDRILDLKYAGYFPIAKQELEQAANGDKQKKRHAETIYTEMVNEAKDYDVLLMTASKFHLVHGMFVGSPHNAFLKSAFVQGGQNLYVLLDYTKLLLDDAQVEKEYLQPRCIRVFDRDSPAKDKNPCRRLGFHEARDRRWPSSWLEAVRLILAEGGSVRIYVAGPSSGSDALAGNNQLKQVIEESETALRAENVYVQVHDGPHGQPFEVPVDGSNFSILPPSHVAGNGVRQIRLRFLEYGLNDRSATGR